MGNASQYWKFIKLTASGKSQAQELVEVRSFFQSKFPNLVDPIANAPIQSSLMTIARPNGSESDTLAQMSLRCFISKQIEMTCVQLEMQFGELHGVRRSELLPLVLDDDGRPWNTEAEIAEAQTQKVETQKVETSKAESKSLVSNVRSNPRYRSVARQVLETFDPDRSSLATWTVRLVKHHRGLNEFLLECGVYLLSDWAILNDTFPPKLRRVLSSGIPLTEMEIQRSLKLLDAYHRVYRRDRLMSRQSGARSQCPQPTAAQLDEMAQMLENSPLSIVGELRRMADRLRGYRIAIRTGKMKTLSIHGKGDEDSREIDLPAPNPEDNESDRAAQAFIIQYRHAFADALAHAIHAAILARYQSLPVPKNRQYLTAMALFHHQGLSMTAIAKEVGLAAQFQVTRLLKLKELRVTVRHEMIELLKRYVKEQAAAFVTLEQLELLDAKIETVLIEQVDLLMAEDAAQAQSPKNYGKGSRFAKVLCQQLDRLAS